MADEIPEVERDEKEHFWKQILNEVSAEASRKISAKKHVLLLGDEYCGKTFLISKLRTPGESELKKGAGLEYTYFDVHDEERDEHTRLSVWIQHGNEEYKGLLKYVFTKENVKDLLILLCVDMSKPWTLLETLEKWSQIIREHLHSLKISAKDLNSMERELLLKFQKYRSVDVSSEETGEEVEPLDENILTNNIGIPIIVVVTKSDYMNTLETEMEYREEHFDFIQKHLRQFCLKCGAALIYTSAKDNLNISLLYKHLLHRIYDFPHDSQPQVTEKDAIFIPMGWDNESKIAIIDEHIKTFNASDPLQDHISKPSSRKVASHEKEIHVDDEQVFLEAQLAILSKMPASVPGQRTQPPAEHGRSVGAFQRISSPGQRSGVRTGIPNPKVKADPSKAAAPNSSETVLANFFNSLLSKNTTGKAGKSASAASANPTASRSEVQAELERMSKKTPGSESDS